MWQSIGSAAVYGLLGIALLVVGYKVFDIVETKVDFAQEIKNGNMAAAVVIAALLLAVSLIVGRTVGS